MLWFNLLSEISQPCIDNYPQFPPLSSSQHKYKKQYTTTQPGKLLLAVANQHPHNNNNTKKKVFYAQTKSSPLFVSPGQPLTGCPLTVWSSTVISGGVIPLWKYSETIYKEHLFLTSLEWAHGELAECKKISAL